MEKDSQPATTHDVITAQTLSPQVGGADSGGQPTTEKARAIDAAARVLTAQMVAAPKLVVPTDNAPPAPAHDAKQKHKRGFLRKLEHLIVKSEQHVVKDAAKLVGGAKTLAIDAAEWIEVYAAELVGVTELVGLRYPVKSYEAQVDAGLYRGSRLDDESMAALKQMGIVGVVSLCMEHTNDAELAAKYQMDSHNVKILDNSAPSIAQMQDFIAFATSHKPTYVHCEAGEGRTGVAVACYRIAVDNFTADQAIAEGRTFGLQLINQIDFIRTFAAAVGGHSAPAPTDVAAPATAVSAQTEMV